ncbi:phage baseplate upper protein [Enterococcus faecalis]|uniref:phage baseplate upper protein n=1 Tax=Enterococcus faecalis TaxID=1351 RepID=UPI0034CF5EC7
MTYNKIGRLKVRTSVANRHDVETNYVFYSYDKGSATLEFRLKNQKNETMDLTNVAAKLLFTAIQDGKEQKFTYLDSQPTINNPKEGIILYPLPDKLLNYEGQVKGYLYLDFEDGSHSDELSFTFTVVRSKIDEALEEVGEVYIKDFEQIKQEVEEAAKQVKNNIDKLLPELTNEILANLPKGTILTAEKLFEGLRNGYFDITRKVDFSEKFIDGMNMDSNACFLESCMDSSLPSPDTITNEINPVAYQKLGQLDDELLTEATDKKNARLILQAKWDMYTEIANWLGETYFMCLKKYMTEDRVEAINERLVSIKPIIVGKGYSSDEQEKIPQVSAVYYNVSANGWEIFDENREEQLKTMTAQIETLYGQTVIDTQGMIYTSLATTNGDTSSLSCDYIGLEYTYRLHLSDIFYLKNDLEIRQYDQKIEMLMYQIQGFSTTLYEGLDRITALEEKVGMKDE